MTQYKFSRVESEVDRDLLLETVLPIGVRVWNNVDKKVHNGDGETLGGVVADDAPPAEVTGVGEGGVTRPLQDAYTGDLPRTPLAYGALADATANDGDALRDTVNSIGAFGGEVQLPKGQICIDALEGAGFKVQAPISIVGQGPAASVINDKFCGPSDHSLTISPNLLAAHEYMRFEAFALHFPNNGQRTGNAGIYVDTTSEGQQLPGLRMSGLEIGQGNGPGIFHANTPVGPNVNGGWFCGGADRCSIKGGVKLGGTGDSMYFFSNRVQGSGIGYEVALVSGASCMVVDGDNITTTGGAVLWHSGSRSEFRTCNVEHNLSGDIVADVDGHRAVVNFLGDTGVCVGNKWIGGLVSAFGSTNANVLIKLKNQRGFLIDGVTLLTGVGGITAIYIDATCQDCIIGQLITQDIDTNEVGDITIVDNGVGTMGLTKTATLANGWVALNPGAETLRYRKSRDGRVHLWGAIRDGTITGGTTITTLPPGFRPAKIERRGMTVNDEDTAAWGTAELVIETNGVVSIGGVPSGYENLRIDVSFQALNNAWAITLE